jgi:hypothetical protein
MGVRLRSIIHGRTSKMKVARWRNRKPARSSRRIVGIVGVLLLANMNPVFAQRVVVANQTEARITLSVRNTPIQKVLNQIASNAGLSVSWSTARVALDGTVSVTLQNTPLRQALATVLKGTGVTAVVSDETQTIVLVPPGANADSAAAVGTSSGKSQADSAKGIIAGLVIDSATRKGIAGGLSGYRPVSWIEHGVLRNLAYNHTYAVQALHENSSLLNSGAFRVHGGDVALDDMIAGVRRGLLISRLWQVRVVHLKSVTVTGMTRDGVWLIEGGKISKAVRNLRFTESILAALNNVIAIGSEQRVFSPGTPAVVPPLQIREFNFDALTDAL